MQKLNILYLAANSVTELGRNESNSINFPTNSFSSQVKQHEYHFNLS